MKWDLIDSFEFFQFLCTRATSNCADNIFGQEDWLPSLKANP
jgi:hypothetical protein